MRDRHPLRAVFLILLGLALSFAGGAQPSGDGPAVEEAPAYHLQQGSIARSRVVVIGRDLVVDGEARSHAVALNGSARISGRVEGDVIVLGGDALLAFWAFLVLLLMGFSHREVLSTSESIRLEPFRNFFVGLTGVVAMLLTALLLSAVAGAFLGVPLLVLVAVVALVLRFWGMVAVFHALGDWICQRLKRPTPLPLTAASYGLIALGVLRFLPWIGIWSWSIATFIGVGAALSTRLGRREVWLQPTAPRSLGASG